LLRAGGENEKIILSPLPRYMKRCCKRKDHLVNRKDEDYASAMGEALSEMRDSMKDLIYGKKIREFKVLNTTTLIMGDDMEDAVDNIRSYWKDDPVHMTTDGYNALLTAILDTAETATFKRPYQKVGGKTVNAKAGGGRKRRQWVIEDDALAHRDYSSKKFARGDNRGGYSARGATPGTSGRGRGGEGQRGGCGGGRGYGGRGHYWRGGPYKWSKN
jgi:hypothetical protein